MILHEIKSSELKDRVWEKFGPHHYTPDRWNPGNGATIPDDAKREDRHGESHGACGSYKRRDDVTIQRHKVNEVLGRMPRWPRDAGRKVV